MLFRSVIQSATRSADGQWRVRGVAMDNGEIATVLVNGQRAKILSQHAGVADWEITLASANLQDIRALAIDRAGNEEKMPHVVPLQSPALRAAR